MTAQLGLAGRCPRCGRPLHLLVELADTADEAWASLRGMRLALPPQVPAGLAFLREALACHAGRCEDNGGRR